MSRTAVSATDYASRNDACGITGYPLTMACWFNPANVTAIHPLMALTQAGAADDSLILWVRGDEAGDKLVARAVYNGAAQFEEVYSSGSVVASSWQHGCAVYGSVTSHDVYLNGVKTAGVGMSVAFPLGLNRTSLGISIRAVNIVASASLAYAAIWNVALTDAEVQRLAAGVNPLEIRNSSIVAAWHCKAASVPEVDQKTGAYPLTVTGTMATGASDPTIVYGSATYLESTVIDEERDMAANYVIDTITATVSSTALTLQTFGFTSGNTASAKTAVICAQNDAVMVTRGASETPTATHGFVVNAGQTKAFPLISGADNLKLIRRNSDATVTIELLA